MNNENEESENSSLQKMTEQHTTTVLVVRNRRETYLKHYVHKESSEAISNYLFGKMRELQMKPIKLRWIYQVTFVYAN